MNYSIPEKGNQYYFEVCSPMELKLERYQEELVKQLRKYFEFSPFSNEKIETETKKNRDADYFLAVYVPIDEKKAFVEAYLDPDGWQVALFCYERNWSKLEYRIDATRKLLPSQVNMKTFENNPDTTYRKNRLRLTEKAIPFENYFEVIAEMVKVIVALWIPCQSEVNS